MTVHPNNVIDINLSAWFWA